jgi:hypothetical protein
MYGRPYNQVNAAGHTSVTRASQPGTLGATSRGRLVNTLRDPPPADPADESSTVIYVGIGLGVLAVGGLVYYLATQKKGSR